MAFAVARRYPSVVRRLVFAKRVPLVRRNVSFVASGLNRGLPLGTPQIAQLLPLRLKNGYATAAKTSAKSSTTKKTSTKESAAKAKKTVTKKKQKNARPRKELTEAEKAELKEAKARRALRQRIKELKVAALTPPKGLPQKPQTIAFPGGRLKAGDRYYANLSDAEKAKLSEQAGANKKENQIAFEKWVKSHSALDIKKANQARASLRRLGYYPKRYPPIKDDRQVKGIHAPFTHFIREAHAMGELDGLTIAQTGVRLGEMWRSMTETEKDKYRKMYQADVVRYEEEYRRQYHEEPPRRPGPRTAA